MKLICTLIICLNGSIYDDFFQRGNDAYRENELADAVEAYGQLVSSGVRSAPVFYNLGNAFYHLGDKGHAVLNYERALSVDPAFGPAIRGLEVLNTPGDMGATVPPGFRTYWTKRDSWPHTTLKALTLVIWWLFWGILLLAMGNPSRRIKHCVVVLMVTIILLAGALLLFDQLSQPAVVVAEESLLRYGPDSRDAVRKPLQGGDRIFVEQMAPGWARVATADGLRGWMARADFEPVSPPLHN